eukprot:8220736-Ditylum_brightwellii.AAC.1
MNGQGTNSGGGGTKRSKSRWVLQAKCDADASWAYNIQNWQEVAELKELWKYIADVNNEDNTFCKLDAPVLTRWWMVGTCATLFKDSMQQWKRVCAAIQNSAPSQSASYKIAS